MGSPSENEKPLFRGVSHQWAFFASLVAGIVLVSTARTMRGAVVAGIFAASVMALLCASAAYHRGRWSERGRSWAHRVDRSMIFVLIAGTYTPVAFLFLPRTQAAITLSVVWSVTVIGACIAMALPKTPIWVMAILYMTLGWAGITMFTQVLHAAGPLVVTLYAAGGVVYTIGAIIYGLRRPDPWPRFFGYHEIFHGFVIAAVAVHYCAVALSVHAV